MPRNSSSNNTKTRPPGRHEMGDEPHLSKKSQSGSSGGGSRHQSSSSSRDRDRDRPSTNNQSSSRRENNNTYNNNSSKMSPSSSYSASKHSSSTKPSSSSSASRRYNRYQEEEEGDESEMFNNQEDYDRYQTPASKKGNNNNKNNNNYGNTSQQFNYNMGNNPNIVMAMMMPNGQLVSMAPMQPQLWPLGIGITDRAITHPGAENDCSCPPCFCCNRPVWFYDRDFQKGSEEASQTCGCCGWKIDDVDVLGQKMSFEGRECCGIDSIFEPEIHIKSNGVDIGKAVMLCPCNCQCGEIDLCLVKDARGNPKYVRREHACIPEFKYWYGDFCGFGGYRWPVYPAGAAFDKSNPISHITYRYHCCVLCHPMWVGVEQMPNVPPQDQKLLLGMALCKWWRNQERENKRSDGGNSISFG